MQWPTLDKINAYFKVSRNYSDLENSEIDRCSTELLDSIQHGVQTAKDFFDSILLENSDTRCSEEEKITLAKQMINQWVPMEADANRQIIWFVYWYLFCKTLASSALLPKLSTNTSWENIIYFLSSLIDPENQDFRTTAVKLASNERIWSDSYLQTLDPSLIQENIKSHIKMLVDYLLIDEWSSLGLPNNSLHDKELIALFTYLFCAYIHPLQDWNGRLSHLLRCINHKKLTWVRNENLPPKYTNFKELFEGQWDESWIVDVLKWKRISQEVLEQKLSEIICIYQEYKRWIE